MRGKNLLLVVGLVFLASFLLRSSTYVLADTSNDTVSVVVNVSEISMVDINPDALSCKNVPPGGVGDESYEENNYGAIWIENIGSTNITKIWFNSTYPSQRPFATGNPQAYDAGNFVVISNGTSGYYFINRVEYIESDPMYVRTNEVINSTSYQQGNIFGRFRNSSYEYFWEFDSASQTQNCTNGTFYISDVPKTKYDTGDADLTDNLGITISPVSHLTELYGVASVTINGSLTYCVIIPEDCSKVIFNRWNADLPGADSSYCSSAINSGYFVNGTVITPGDVAKAYIEVYVPYGVPYGVVKQGTVIVYVTTS